MEILKRFRSEFEIVRMSANSLVVFNDKYGEVYISRKDFNNLVRATDYRIVRKQSMSKVALWISIQTWSWDGEVVNR
mgnify:FL=1